VHLSPERPKQPDRLLRWILLWTGVTLLSSWLPLIRGLMEGSSYEWGSGYFGHAYGGRGFTPASWILVAELAYGLVLLYLGWRGARAPFAPLLLAWHALLAVNATFNAVRSPEDYRFQGDSLGIDLNLAWVGPLFFGGFFLLGLRWAWKDRGAAPAPAPAWTRANTAWAVGLALLLPVQLLLLRSGSQHGLGDQIGVCLTIAQWLLVPMALKVRR
jgi:hypothetical protein